MTGVVLALISCSLFSCMDTAIKWLSGGYSLLQVMFFNALLSFVPLTVVILRSKRDGPLLRTRRLPRHLLRSVLAMSSAFCAFYAYSQMPVADAYSIAFSGPLFITALSVPILGERVGWRRWTAVVAGFIGVLVMLRPGAGGIGLPSLSILCGTAFYGLSITLVRSLSRTESLSLLLLIPNLLIVAVCGASLPFLWVTPTWGDFGLLVFCGLANGCAQLCQIAAFSRAPAAVVAPFQYSQMFWAIGFGYVIWGSVPGQSVLLGCPIVIGSGLYILRREALRRRAEREMGAG